MNKVAYEVLLDPRAERDLASLEKRDFRRVDSKIRSLASNPRPRKTEKIGDSDFRIRVGDWRILYLVYDESKRVIISRVKRRNERTYKDYALISLGMTAFSV